MATDLSPLRPLLIACLGSGLLLAGCNNTTRAASPAQGDESQANPQLQLLNRVNALESELSILRNTVEIQQNELERLRTRQAEIYDDVDRRLRAVERSGYPSAVYQSPGATAADPEIPPVPGAPPEVDPGAMPAAAAPELEAEPPVQTEQVATAQEQQDYDQAFELLKQSRYEEAIAAFKEFLTRYPRSALADSAQYWIGESRYVNRAFEAALYEYNLLIRRYPGSRRLPDAMLKVGYIHYENQQWDEARRALNAVVVRYPGSRVAVSAKMRLDQMAKQGH